MTRHPCRLPWGVPGMIPRPKLAKLPAEFDRSSAGWLTAGNSPPRTNGSALIWVGDEEGLRRLGVRPLVKLIDWEVAAVDFDRERQRRIQSGLSAR